MAVDFHHTPPKMLINSTASKVVLAFDFLPEHLADDYVKQYRGESTKKTGSWKIRERKTTKKKK